MHRSKPIQHPETEGNTMKSPPKQKRRNNENNSSSTNSIAHRSGTGRPNFNSNRYRGTNKTKGIARSPNPRHKIRRHGNGPSRNENGNSATDAASSTIESPSESVLPWPDPTTHYISKSDEERLIPALIHWGKTERGMMKDQPPFRLRKILQLLGIKENNKRQHNEIHTSISNRVRISLIQSLSLRRHHLKLLNPQLSMADLRLGSNDDIRTSADLFERCVESHLKNIGVEFLTEQDQIRLHRTNAPGVRQPLTPDFKMKDGHSLKLILENDNTGGEQHTIHWIEAKMFYGASTIPHSTNNAVGCLLPKARQYVKYFGPGAIVFMYGCGDELARELKQIGVVALDCRELDLGRVVRHQIGWCGDGSGVVLF